MIVITRIISNTQCFFNWPLYNTLRKALIGEVLSDPGFDLNFLLANERVTVASVSRSLVKFQALNLRYVLFCQYYL